MESRSFSTTLQETNGRPGDEGIAEDHRPSLHATLDRIALALEQIAQRLDSVPRLVDAIAPAPSAIVGTPYIASALGCTTVWVAEMVRLGQIPRDCVVPGTGNGKPWKFNRSQVDEWLRSR